MKSAYKKAARSKNKKFRDHRKSLFSIGLKKIKATKTTKKNPMLSHCPKDFHPY